MKGSLRAVPGRANYWEMRADAGADPVTKRRRQISRGFRGTRKEAERALRQLCREVDDGRHRGTDESFASLLEAWYASRLSSWSPTTAARNRQILDLHILPALGRRPVSKLRPSDLDRLYGQLEQKGEGLAPATIRKAHSIMRSALNLAERWEWLERNPAARASPPVVHQGEVRAPSPAQVQAVMDEAARYPGFPLYLRLAGATGARRGELCGLRWGDVDTGARTVRISRAVILAEPEAVQDPKMARVGDGLYLKTPKTGDGRLVDLDELTVQLLLEHMEHMRARAAEQGVDLVDDPFIFSEPMRSRRLDGSQPWSPREVSRRWRCVCAEVGLAAKLHSLRHFVATELLGAGVPLPTVSKRLGHKRTSTTSDIYAAYLPASGRAAADIMGQRLTRPAPAPPDPTRTGRSPA